MAPTSEGQEALLTWDDDGFAESSGTVVVCIAEVDDDEEERDESERDENDDEREEGRESMSTSDSMGSHCASSTCSFSLVSSEARFASAHTTAVFPVSL